MSLRRLSRHPAVLAAGLVIVAALVLLPGLSGPGLWEPQEMAVADQAAARVDGTYQIAASPTACPTTAAVEGARTLTPRAAAWGLRHVANSDLGMRVPLVLLGLLGVLAVFAVGWRLGGTRAGVIGAAVLLSFPLWSLQSRQLTSELPGAVGATLIIYGLCALAAPRRRSPLALALDLLIAAVALAVGGHLAFHGSGALVGLLPPLVAVAIAGAFAVPALGQGLAWAWRRLDVRREPTPAPAIDPWRTAAVAVAALATLGLSVWIAVQVFDLGPRTPGTRQVADHSILTSDCWSSAIGGLWRKEDDLRATYDSLFEQAGFGMFPWSILAVIALGALASGLVRPERRFAGTLLFAWAAAGWLVAAVFSRKVGAVIFPGFPACAIAIGLFVDELYAQRAAADRDDGAAARYRAAAWSLAGVAVLLGALVMGKDLQSFPERMTTLLLGAGEQLKYPTKATLLGLPTKSWIVVVGTVTVLPFVLDLCLWRPRRRPDQPPTLLDRTGLPALAHRGGPLALGLTLALGLFWTHGWHRSLSDAVSSKHLFAVYRDQRHAGEPLGILGNMGNGPRYYAGGPWETLHTRDDLLSFLGRPTRVFALSPASELCAIHKQRPGHLAYYVLDDSNPQTLLLSNQLGGGRDQNPIATSILRTRPADVGTPLAVIYDDTIEVVGIQMPATVRRGASFDVTLTYHVKKPISGAWKFFGHFDGPGPRFMGDHVPIRDRCATHFWQVGDYIIDRFTVIAGNASTPRGNYDLMAGFFQGAFPNYRNMTVTQGTKDNNNRVKLGTVRLK